MNTSRRFFVAQLGAGAATIAAAPSAFAQAPGGTKPAVWSQEYWAQKGDVKLYLFRKRREAPKAGAKPLPVLFLAHGSSMSSRPTFDVTVPGHGTYSLMDVFAGYGFDVWTMDFESYGRSTNVAERNSD